MDAPTINVRPYKFPDKLNKTFTKYMEFIHFFWLLSSRDYHIIK